MSGRPTLKHTTCACGEEAVALTTGTYEVQWCAAGHVDATDTKQVIRLGKLAEAGWERWK